MLKTSIDSGNMTERCLACPLLSHSGKEKHHARITAYRLVKSGLPAFFKAGRSYGAVRFYSIQFILELENRSNVRQF